MKLTLFRRLCLLATLVKRTSAAPKATPAQTTTPPPTPERWRPASASAEKTAPTPVIAMSSP